MLKYLPLIFMISLFSCSKDQAKEDMELIETWLSERSLTFIEDNGVYIVIENEGSTEKPKSNSEVTVHYKGYYLDGVTFDSSYDRNEKATFSLTRVIEGWQIGIPKFGIDGKGKILIPSRLGYGSNPPFGVRQDAVLVFDVEVFDFK